MPRSSVDDDEAERLDRGVERVAPRDVLQAHRDQALDLRRDDDVGARDLGDRVDHLLDVRVLEREVDARRLLDLEHALPLLGDHAAGLLGDELQRLAPVHVLHVDRDRSLDARIHDDVDVGLALDAEHHVAQVAVLELQGQATRTIAFGIGADVLLALSVLALGLLTRAGFGASFGGSCWAGHREQHAPRKCAQNPIPDCLHLRSFSLAGISGDSPVGPALSKGRSNAILFHRTGDASGLNIRRNVAAAPPHIVRTSVSPRNTNQIWSSSTSFTSSSSET
jgi:hypothetical protein